MGFDVMVGTVVKKVLLYILHHIFNLALALGICFSAKVKSKTLGPGIPPEGIGQNNVPSVLTYYKDLILVINNLIRDTSHIFKGFFVGLYGQLRGKVSIRKPNIFKTGTRQHYRKEEDFCPGT